MCFGWPNRTPEPRPSIIMLNKGTVPEGALAMNSLLCEVIHFLLLFKLVQLFCVVGFIVGFALFYNCSPRHPNSSVLFPINSSDYPKAEAH